MDKGWADKCKEVHGLLGKKDTYKDGIKKLIEFRAEMFEQITQIVNSYPEEAFYQAPFAKAQGYHNKTLSYSIWHIFRIEDIVAHELIARDTQVLFAGKYNEQIGTTLITTGNEICGSELIDFSKSLNTSVLYEYAREVMLSTNEILTNLDYSDFKRTFTAEDKKSILDNGYVSKDEKAIWLVDYWCGKDIRGLIKMPFSRHWIMHIEAMRRIKNKLCE